MQLLAVILSKQSGAAREIPCLTAASYQERRRQRGQVQLIVFSWPGETELVGTCLLAVSLPVLRSACSVQRLPGRCRVPLIIQRQRSDSFVFLLLVALAAGSKPKLLC